MGSVTCERCGFVSFATSEVCKQCGGPLPGPSAARNWLPPQQPQPNWQQQQQQAAPDWQPQQQAYAGQQQAHAGQWPPPAQGWLPPPPHGDSAHYQAQAGYYGTDDGLPKRKGMAVVSMLCGLLALPVMIVGAVAAIELGAPAAILGALVGFVMMILALTLGIAGTVRANKNPAEFGGKGMAIAGIVLGCLLLVSIVPVGIISAIAIPNLLAARRASNEAAAIGRLRQISAAQSTYISTAGDNREYGSAEDLVKYELLDRGLAEGTMSGYRFEVEASGASYVATATPVDYPSSGGRSFYMAEDGVIRGADKQGELADEDDPPMADGFLEGPASAAGEDVEWTEDGPMIRRTGSRLNGRR